MIFMNNTSAGYPLNGFNYGVRTNMAKRILNNKDAALIILAAYGGILRIIDIQNMLRSWRPGSKRLRVVKRGYYDTKKDVYVKPTYSDEVAEKYFTYLFNGHYGFISNRDRDEEWPQRQVGQRGMNYMRNYTVGAYMWRPSKGVAAISKLGYKRLQELGVLQELGA